MVGSAWAVRHALSTRMKPVCHRRTTGRGLLATGRWSHRFRTRAPRLTKLFFSEKGWLGEQACASDKEPPICGGPHHDQSVAYQERAPYLRHSL